MEMSYAERFTPPRFGEESIPEQTARVKSGLKKMLSQPLTQNVIICTHYSVINIIANIANRNYDLATYADGRFHVEEGHLCTLTVDPQTMREGCALP
jgi:broad specificity phosphatase PhoE